MTERFQVYKCDHCGNIVEVLHPGAPALVCCDSEMKLLKENTTDAAKEKHVPVIEVTTDGFRIEVGSTPHPMEEDHYIEWIEIIGNGKSYIQHLNPGDKPEAAFDINTSKIIAREYCNKHGLWKAEV